MLRRRNAPQQTLAEHLAPLMGYRGPEAEALFAGNRKRERVIIRQWPADPASTGAVIACRYMKGWHASDAAMRQEESRFNSSDRIID